MRQTRVYKNKNCNFPLYFANGTKTPIYLRIFKKNGSSRYKCYYFLFNCFSLRIINPTEADAGAYTCMAENSVGKRSTTAFLSFSKKGKKPSLLTSSFHTDPLTLYPFQFKRLKSMRNEAQAPQKVQFCCTDDVNLKGPS